MYDKLWEDNPKVQKIRADSKAEGQIQGEVAALQRTLVNIVGVRFPAIAELAQQQVKHLNKPEVLDQLVQQAMTAPDEATVRWLLTNSPAN